MYQMIACQCSIGQHQELEKKNRTVVIYGRNMHGFVGLMNDEIDLEACNPKGTAVFISIIPFFFFFYQEVSEGRQEAGKSRKS